MKNNNKFWLRILQAGDNHHFHPTCARCTKCGDPFGDGEEMYLQGEISRSLSIYVANFRVLLTAKQKGRMCALQYNERMDCILNETRLRERMVTSSFMSQAVLYGILNADQDRRKMAL